MSNVILLPISMSTALTLQISGQSPNQKKYHHPPIFGTPTSWCVINLILINDRKNYWFLPPKISLYIVVKKKKNCIHDVSLMMQEAMVLDHPIPIVAAT